MGIYAQAIGAILLIAFIAFVSLSGKSWRWHHITALVLVLLSSYFFALMAASVLKTHQTWQTRAQQLAKDLETEQQKTSELQFGVLNATGEGGEGLRPIQEELKRVVVDRGRVWRDVQLTNVQGNQATFKFPDRNITGLDAPPPLHRLVPNTIIYGFKEKQNPEGFKVPAFFMGEYVVQAQPAPAADTVVLSPSQPLDRLQQSEVKADGVTWAFYEVMPIDGHFKFEGLTDEQLAELLKPGGWHGRPNMVPQGMPAQEIYDKVVDQYLRDGKEATPDDPPERVHVIVKLTQAWKVDVDAAEAAGQIPTREFDVTGLALTPELRQGAQSEFEPGDEIEVDSGTAQKLIDQGIAQPLKNIYRRPLNDYAYDLAEINRNSRVLDERARLVTKANVTVQQAIDKANKQIGVRKDEKAKLEEDLTHVKQERDAMKQYVATLQKYYDESLSSLRAVYTENLELVDRLRRIQEAILNSVRQELAAAGGR